MKIHLASSLTVLLALTAQLALAKDISLNDLPAAAKRVADSETKSSGTLKRVESVKHQGQNIYALTFQRADGSNKYIYLRPDGTYVQDVPTPPATGATPAPATAVAASSQNVQLNQL